MVIGGSMVFLVGALNVIKYESDYYLLASYGKGFVWGNGILVVAGFLIVYKGLKKRTSY